MAHCFMRHLSNFLNEISIKWFLLKFAALLKVTTVAVE